MALSSRMAASEIRKMLIHVVVDKDGSISVVANASNDATTGGLYSTGTCSSIELGLRNLADQLKQKP